MLIAPPVSVMALRSDCRSTFALVQHHVGSVQEGSDRNWLNEVSPHAARTLRRTVIRNTTNTHAAPGGPPPVRVIEADGR